jgi:2-methylcitrate dehydratase PrpD
VTDIAARLAEHAVALQPKDLPDEVADRTKMLLLDLLGVGLRGSGPTDSTDAIRGGVRAIARPGEVTVWGEREPLAPAHAALLNGSYAHTLDFDDTHRAGSVHPGAAVIPTALALGEVEHVDGPTLLAAIVAGYDVTCRIAMALDPGVHYGRGYHPTATAGHFGAAAAGGRVLGLSADHVRQAFGIGGSQAAGSLQFLENGAWNKRIHPGLAAHNAILGTGARPPRLPRSGRAVRGHMGAPALADRRAASRGGDGGARAAVRGDAHGDQALSGLPVRARPA